MTQTYVLPVMLFMERIINTSFLHARQGMLVGAGTKAPRLSARSIRALSDPSPYIPACSYPLSTLTFYPHWSMCFFNSCCKKRPGAPGLGRQGRLLPLEPLLILPHPGLQLGSSSLDLSYQQTPAWLQSAPPVEAFNDCLAMTQLLR